MKVVVTGSRGATDARVVFDALDAIHRERGPITRVAHGAYDGIDKLSGKWARARNIDEGRHPAQWRIYGAAAGPIRNTEMLEAERPDAVVEFPGGTGTADCVKKAKRMGIEVIPALGGGKPTGSTSVPQ